MKRILVTLLCASLYTTVQAQEWTTTGDNTTTGKVTAKEYTFPRLIYYDFSKMPRTQLSPMSIKLFDDYYTQRPGGSSPDNNSYGTLLAIYGRSSHWESNIYFGVTTKKMYFRTSTWSGGNSENGITGDFNEWRTLLDSKSDVKTSGLLKAEGSGNHYFSNGNVGIGTVTPSTKLEIATGTTLSNGFNISSNSQDGGRIYTSYESGRAGLNFVEADDPFLFNFLQTNYNLQLSFHKGKMGIGTITTGNHRLAVEGSIGAREIKVEASGWSDFVFEKEYDLPTLTEVEQHIKEKGHLENIPSAKEVEKNGFYLGEMDAKLLQKIEELTLYTIQQEKALHAKDVKLKKLEDETEKLKERLARIEALLLKR